MGLRGYVTITTGIVIGVAFCVLGFKYKKNLIVYFLVGILSYLIPLIAYALLFFYILSDLMYVSEKEETLHFITNLFIAVMVSVFLFLWLKIKLNDKRKNSVDIKDIGNS